MKLFSRLDKKDKLKTCPNCQKEFCKSKDEGNEQWLSRKYCSRKCFAEGNTGHMVSITTRNKIKVSQIGKIISTETRQKMSISRLGVTPWNKDTVGLMKSWNKGKTGLFKQTQEWKDRLSEKMKGNKYKVGISSWNKGLKGYRAGELNNKWKGGISQINKTKRQLLMETIEYKIWRKSIFERDNYTCQECGQIGGILNAHHIKPYSIFPKLRVDMTNGITLCTDCHKTIHKMIKLAVLNNI